MDEQKLLRKKRRALEEHNFALYDSTVNSLCNYYTDKGLYQEALNMFKEVANVYKSRPQFRMEYGRAERMIGEMYTNLENFTEAVSHVEIYLKIAKLEQNNVEEQRAYATIGRTHMLHGTSFTDPVAMKEPLYKAEQAFLRSLAICKSKRLLGIGRIELLEMEARLYLNLGIAKDQLDEYEQAEKYMEMALSLCRDNDLFELLHKCYMTSADFVHSRQNDVTKAMRLLNLGLGVAERLDRGKTKICEALLLKSVIFIKLGDFQSAKQVLLKAYKTQTSIPADRKRIENELKTVAAICYAEDALITTASEDYDTKKKLFEKLGDGACHLYNFNKAIDYYLNMLKNAEKCFVSEKELIPTYVSLYQTYIDLKQYESALVYLWKEYELVKENSAEAMATLLNIANVYELSAKDFWTIENMYQRARKESQKMNDKRAERVVLLKQIALRQKHQMNTLIEILREEASMSGIDLEANDKQQGNVDGEGCGSANEDDNENNTPDIGDEICLDDLTGGSESEEERPAERQPRSVVRRRGTAVPFKRNEKGETPVHVACISGNLAQVKLLLDQGHAVNIRDNAGWMPLHEAANHGHVEIVKLLIEQGAPINDKGGRMCDGITALHDACGNGCLEVVEVLLDAGANATLLTDFRDTPYHSLEKWRKKQQLDASEQNFYDTIRARLLATLQKAGVKIDVAETCNTSQTVGRARRSTTSSYGKQQTTVKSGRPRRRNSSSSDDDDDDAEPRGAINNILEQEFSTTNVSADDEDGSNSCDRTLIPTEEFNGTINVNDYRNVMDALRKPGAAQLSPSKFVTFDSNKRRMGFLAVDEVGESWLDDDTATTTTKKRKVIPSKRDCMPSKRLSPRKGYNSQQTKENNHPNTVYVSPLKVTDAITSASSSYEIDGDSVDAFDMMMYPVASSSRVPKRKSLSLSRDITRRKQHNNLQNMGFVQVKRSGASQDSSENVVSSSDMCDSVCATIPPQQPQSSVSSVHVPSMTSVKVKVNEQLFNVPINKDMINDLTIGWLAEETARRYYNLKGLQPVLQITTSDGAVFENSDPLSVTLGATVGSSVLEWILPSLSQRYLESCRTLKCAPDEHIKTHLELIQATHQLCVTDQFLDTLISKAMFKALHYQSNLETIDLSNNFIQDEGCRYLAEALPTLDKLKVLRLNGNHITSVGVSTLSTKMPIATTSHSFALETLSLSFNPLGNLCAGPLALLVGHLKNLRTLHISSVDMTEFSSINFSGITDLDISLNQMRLAEAKKILKQVNACKVERLNVAFAVQDEQGAGAAVAAFLQTGTLERLQNLNLTGLHLDDGDVYEIVQPLRRARQLDELYLAENTKLSAIGLMAILQQLSVNWLIMGGCPMGLGNLDTADVGDMALCCKVSLRVSQKHEERDTEILTRLWRRYHGDRARIEVHQRNVVLSVCNDDE